MTGGQTKIRILVVEDEALIAMTIEDVIESMGCDMVGPAADLDEALALAVEGAFDCAVLDVNIRGGSTYGIAELLRGRGCPFFMATGYSNWSMPAHLVGEKRLTKPYSSVALEAELRLLCAQVHARSPGCRDLPS